MSEDYGDFAWKTSRLWLGPLTQFFARARAYGDHLAFHATTRDGALESAICADHQLSTNADRTIVYGIADRRLGKNDWAIGRYSIADIHLFRLYWRMFNSLHPTSGELKLARCCAQRLVACDRERGGHPL